MAEKTLLNRDETSAKYCQVSTRWITEHFIQNIIMTLQNDPPAFMLDVGCGTGYITDKIVSSMNTALICCDMDRDRILFARSHFHLETVLADITCLPFKSSSFDTILAVEIIEHLPDPEKALKEISRIMTKNAVITVPHDPFFMMANFFRGKNLRSFGNPTDHVNHYNGRSLRSLLQKFFHKVDISSNAFLWLLARVEK
jgi:ubiquinone/menaquinone biosynthesis C-methylase UbiE